jgi:hypothetical protein
MKIPNTAQQIIDAMSIGTLFSYSHLTNEGRLLHGQAMFTGTPSNYSIDDAIEILKWSSANNMFIPEQVGLRPLYSDVVFDGEAWHRLEGPILQEVLGVPLTVTHIDAFIESFTSADWNETESPAYCELMTLYELDRLPHTS